MSAASAVVGGHPVLDVERPAAEAAALHEDGPMGAALRHVHFRRDGLGLVLDVQEDVFGHAGHAFGERQ